LIYIVTLAAAVKLMPAAPQRHLRVPAGHWLIDVRRSCAIRLGTMGRVGDLSDKRKATQSRPS
jgi:hypothetical protein